MNDAAPTIPRSFIAAMPPPRTPPVEADAATAEIPAASIRRLNLNESPFPPSPRAVAAMQEACARVNRYPDPAWRDLAKAVSARIGVPASRLVFGNGSDESISAAGRIAINPGDEVVVPSPSFPGYTKCAAIYGAKLVPVALRQDGANDVDAMLGAVTPRTRILFCCTPNNPTGQMLGAAEVARLAAGVPDTCLLVVDEAYYEFGRHAGGAEHLPALEKRAGPWAVFRTFSKAYGLAGIRCGYTIAGSDSLARALQQVRGVFNVNAVAQAGALAALEDPGHTQYILDATRHERERLAAGLARLGCEPLPSVGNFVAAPTPKPGAEVVAALARRGILISTIQAPGYERFIRVTIGASADTDALLAALAEALRG